MSKLRVVLFVLAAVAWAALMKEWRLRDPFDYHIEPPAFVCPRASCYVAGDARTWTALIAPHRSPNASVAPMAPGPSWPCDPKRCPK